MIDLGPLIPSGWGVSISHHEGQGSYNVKPLSPSAPSSDPYGSEVLGTPFTTASCPPTSAAPLPTPGDLRRLAKAPHPTHLLKCPRCDSLETKFCYYNNYSLSQPRYFCKNCKRYWTAGGALRNVPVGGGLRKNKRCKLKLQAEAEAAAAAARELAPKDAASNQVQHHEANKPQSPVLASSGAMGSSANSTSCTSSIVSGIPANFVVTAAPAMIRTSSGSDGSSVEYVGSDNCGSAGSAGAYVTDRQQNGNQLQHFFGELCAAQATVPQFYSSYSTSLPASNLQEYRGTPSERAARYHEGGYVNQLVHSSSSCMDLLSGDKGVGSNPAHANNGEEAYHVLVHSIGSHGGGDVCSHDLKEEKEEIINAKPQYDWQLMSENLFSGAAAEGFLPLPGGSWSDFSQFQDPSGPAG